MVRVGSFRGVDTADGLPLFDAVLALVDTKGKGRGVIRFDGRPAAASACAWNNSCACSGEIKSSSSGSRYETVFDAVLLLCNACISGKCEVFVGGCAGDE